MKLFRSKPESHKYFNKNVKNVTALTLIKNLF